MTAILRGHPSQSLGVLVYTSFVNGDAAAAGYDARRLTVLADCTDHEDEIVAQIRLAADQRDLADAGHGERGDELQHLVGGELVVARAAGSRPAVQAPVITSA